MEKSVVLNTKYAEVIYFQKNKLGQVTWKDFKAITSEEYRKTFLSLLEYTKDKDFFYFISDARKGAVARPADRKWFQKEVIPTAAQRGLKSAAIVIKHDPFRKYYMNALLKYTHRNAPFDLKIFYSYDKAYNWLMSFEN